MTLSDLLAQPLPIISELRTLALVFSPEMRQRLIDVQTQYGSQQFGADPGGPLADGRYYHCADLLTEIGPGGIYGAGFAHLDASKFVEVEVLPIAEVLALLPA